MKVEDAVLCSKQENQERGKLAGCSSLWAFSHQKLGLREIERERELPRPLHVTIAITAR